MEEEEINYEEKAGLFEGDIDTSFNTYASMPNRKWPNNIVDYYFVPRQFSKGQIKKIIEESLQKRPSITFRIFFIFPISQF